MYAGYECIKDSVEGKTTNSLKLSLDYFADPFPFLCQDDLFYSKDILILIEGSELDGPIPKLVIPEMFEFNFDIDEFAVSLMSIDMQSTVGFFYSLKSDAQILQTISFKGYYAFVNYFTLYDIMARGFVRPYCLVYLTKEYSKLINLYDDFSSSFNNITKDLKIKNAKLFMKDLLNCLADFEFTKTSYCMVMGGNRDFNSKEINILKSITHETEIDLLISEIIQLLKPLQLLLEQEGYLTNSSESINNYIPKLRVKIRESHKKHLRIIEDLCDTSNFLEYLSPIYYRFNCNEISIDFQIGDLCIGGSVILNFLSLKRFQNSVKDMNQYSEHYTNIGTNILQFMRRYTFSANLFFSLLIGRPTFIIDSNKLNLQSILDTICLFLPGSFRSIDILEASLDILSIESKVNLIGILIPKNYSRNIMDCLNQHESSIFNVELKTYKGPKYKGIYLNKITTSKLCFDNDESFISFIKCVLHELAMKAYIYYHGFFQHPENCKNTNCQHNISSQDFLQSISIQDDDCLIVQHLSQIVFKQQFVNTND